MARLRFLTSWLKRLVGRRPAEQWDQQYADGRWEILKSPAEQDRLLACADLLRRYAPAGQVLEIGCGEGLLFRCLGPRDYTGWLGVDISKVAIARAQAFCSKQVRFIVGDMQTLALNDSYDAIVFSESIYYSPDPAALLRHYAARLNFGGVFIISIFEKLDRRSVWQSIHAVARTIDSHVTRNNRGAWVCEVLRMH